MVSDSLLDEGNSAMKVKVSEKVISAVGGCNSMYKNKTFVKFQLKRKRRSSHATC